MKKEERYLDVIDNYNKIVNYLIEFVGIDEEVINFAFSIYGVNIETLNNLIYYYSESKDIWQYAEYEDEDKVYKEFGLNLF